jgi:hypothetical protein
LQNPGTGKLAEADFRELIRSTTGVADHQEFTPALFPAPASWAKLIASAECRSLQATTLGQYEILEPVGAGGIGVL